MLIGGAMTYTFLKAQGVDVGGIEGRPTRSWTRPAKLLPQVGGKIVAAGRLPRRAKSDDLPQTQVVEGDIPDGLEGVDIGPKTEWETAHAGPCGEAAEPQRPRRLLRHRSPPRARGLRGMAHPSGRLSKGPCPQLGGADMGWAASARATVTRLAAAALPVVIDHSCPSSVSRYEGPGPGPLFQYVHAAPGMV